MAESDYSPSQSPPPGGATEARTNRDSIKKGFSDLVRFADVNFSRAKQYVTEKAGKAEAVTEYDEEFELLCNQMDQIKIMTERMLTQVVTMMQPNPNVRLEDWARTKLDRPKPSRMNAHNLLGSELTKASQVFGLETQYGTYLSHCGEVEVKIGECQQRFEDRVMKDVVTPLKAFLEIDIKNITRERKALNVKRLDLDARKASNRRAQGDKVVTTEMALREAQSEYEQQLEKVRKSLKKVVETHVNHMGYLRSFMAAQKAFYEESQAFMADLGGGTATNMTSPLLSVGGKDEEGGQESSGGRKARMLFDYNAVNDDELSVNSGEIVVVTPLPGDDEYLMAEFKGQTGKLPSTYIDYL